MSQDIFKAVKERLPMEQLVGTGGYVLCSNRCSKSGRYTARVFDDCIHCHKCGHREDIFAYIQRTQQVSIKEALRIAADMAGIPLKPDPERTELLRRCNAELHRQLFIYQRDKLEELIQWRGWDIKTISALCLGYCDPDGEALDRTGIPLETLADLGFYTKPRYPHEGYLFNFADRFTFPIRNRYGHIISLKGRLSRGYSELEEKRRGKSVPLRKDGPWGQHSHMDYLYLEEHIPGAKKAGYVVITEGEPNGATLFGQAIPTVGLQTNKGLTKHAYKLQGIPRKYICLDNDEQTRKTLMKEVYDYQMACPDDFLYLVTLPYLNGPDRKVDVDEYFHQHGKTREDFMRLLDEAPDVAHLLIQELGVNPRNYALLYPLINRMKSRRDELINVFSMVSGRSRELIEFAVDTAVREERTFPVTA